MASWAHASLAAMQLSMPKAPRPALDPRRYALGAVSAALVLALLGVTFLMYRLSLSREGTIPGLRLGATEVGALDGAELEQRIQAAAKAFTNGTVKLTAGKGQITATRGALGATVDVKLTRQVLVGLGKSGNLIADLSQRVRARRGKLRENLAVSLDRDRALAYFTELKERLDRHPVPPKLDLERKNVKPGRTGLLLRVYDCLAATELALRGGQVEVPLAVTVLPPGGKKGTKGGVDMAKLDISQVLAEFTTAYSLKQKDRDRGFNLKVGAGKLDGYILGPGQTFSYNDVVGPRTKAEGYRMAPVLSDGEVVDGMAGGSCQLSSTLFAAAFFSGLELVSSRPHTRPSSYIKMGLDATVVYPSVDMVLKNPYPFPVVLHFTVTQGKVKVRILGKARPWNKVVFEREVKEVVPFNEVIRQDSSIPAGRTVVSQNGVNGYRLIRRRRLYKGDAKEPAVTESRDLKYPPTTRYIRKGTGPADPKWEPPKPKTPFGDVAELYTMER